MASEVFKSKVVRCAKDISALHELISSSEENKEKYKIVTLCVADIVAALLDSKAQEEVQELCDKLKNEAGEFNDEGDNLGLKQAASSLATKVAMVKPADYVEFMQLLVEADSDDVISAILRDAERQAAASLGAEVKIEKVEFADRDNNGATRHDFGMKLYTDVCYLKPRITYQVLRVGEPVVLWYKIISPSGVVIINNQEGMRSGFTWRGNLPCNEEGLFTEIIGGFGSDDYNTYTQVGTWRVEFYNGDTCLYKATFEIHPLPTTSTPATRTTGAKSTSTPTPSLPTSPKTTTNTYSRSLNDIISDIGDWFEDNSDAAVGVVSVIIAAIPAIAILIGVISVFVESGIIWGILAAIFGIGIGYYVVIFMFGLGAVVSTILFKILRLIFYNLYTLLAVILIPIIITIAISVYNNPDCYKSLTPTTIVKQTTTYYCTASSGVNVRMTPSTSATVVGKLAHGQAVEVHQYGASFSKIAFKHSKGETAWVSSKYISTTKPIAR